jgi:hypothetical protein
MALLFSPLRPSTALGQGTVGPTVVDSSVGYIDSAIPGNQFRLRYDAAFDNRFPNRAEFFWAKGQPLGPGVPAPETRVDYHELSGYLEGLLTQRLSAFVEVPWRFLNPEVNADTNGLADVNAGFKWAFAYSNDCVGAFQLRTYAPSGDSTRGLGTHHVSLEPALLLYNRSQIVSTSRASCAILFRSAARTSRETCSATASGLTTSSARPII